MRKITYITAALLVTLSLTFCSDDDPTGPSGSDSTGEASFNVSGDLELSFDGNAQFSKFDEANIETWALDFTDAGQNYTITISTQDQEEVERPPEGTYTIGFVTDDFIANFLDDSEDGFENFAEYSTMAEGFGGEIVITESSTDLVEGTFNFTAVELLDEGGGEIEVTEGEFSATPRQ